jgi:DNA repair protein RecO (recombination protein O)
LADTLDLVEASRRPRLVLQGFMLHLLRLLGYLPELFECVRCRAAMRLPGDVCISPSQGGLLCGTCRSATTDGIQVSPAALGFLRGAGASTLRVVDRISLSLQVLQEVSGILQAFLRHMLGRPLRCQDFLSHL